MKRRSKKFIVVACLVLVFSLFVDSVSAQTASASATPTTATQSATPTTPSASSSATPKLDPLRERQQAVRATVAQIHSQRISMRFEYYYKRFRLLGEGLENQLDDLETNGVEVASQSAQLRSAQAELEAAKFLADEASKSYQLISEGSYEEQKELSSEAREITQSAKTAFSEVLTLFKDVVQSIKSL